MKKFLIKLLIVLSPVWLTLLLYIILDPFKALNSYDDYYDGGATSNFCNHPMATMKSYERSTRELGIRFNAFYLGDSRSVNMSAAEWEKYLPAGSRVFHLDAFNNSLPTLLAKMKYLDRSGAPIEHLIFLIDGMLLNRAPYNYGYLFILPPSLGGNPVKFHVENLRAFYSTKFLPEYLWYRLTGKINNGNEWYTKPGKYRYDAVNNELHEATLDSLLLLHQWWNKDEIAVWESRLNNRNVDTTVYWTAESGMILREIADILRRHHTDYTIIIPVNGFRDIINPADVDSLKSVFGDDNVYRLDTIPTSPHWMHDNFHFSHEASCEMLRRLYQMKREKVQLD